MSGVKLYELAEARDILDQFLAETEGEETPTIAALFEQLEGEIETKAERVALWIREKEAEAGALRTEEQRLAKKRQARTNAIDSTKRYFAGILEQLGRKEAGGNLAKLAIQANPPSLEGELTQEQLAALEVECTEALRACVILVPETRKLDRAAALRVLKSGETIDGLTIKQSTSLRIR